MEKLSLRWRLLLGDVLSKRAPSLCALIKEERQLTAEQYASIRSVICDELIEAGLRKDDTPTRYGEQLEELIDKMGRLVLESQSNK